MRYFIPLVFCVSVLPFGATAQDEKIPEMPGFCQVSSASDIIRVVVCDNANLQGEALADIGKAACGEALPCGAWIWIGGEGAPALAPENHDGLTQDEIVSSRAVWIAEDKNLIEISKVE